MLLLNIEDEIMLIACLTNKSEYSYFSYGDKTIKFYTGKSLEKYTSIINWDNGYLVVNAKNYNRDEEEDYIDLIPIMNNLYMDTADLGEISEVKIDV